VLTAPPAALRIDITPALRFPRRTMPASDPAFLGRGWAFPPAFHPAVGDVAMVSGEEDIRQSIALILSTEPGERAMQPRFGCALRRFAFQRTDLLTRNRIHDEVSQSLLDWEPRIRVDRVTVETDDTPASLQIRVEYTIRAINSRFNVVFPYRVAEGTRLPA